MAGLWAYLKGRHPDVRPTIEKRRADSGRGVNELHLMNHGGTKAFGIVVDVVATGPRGSRDVVKGAAANELAPGETWHARDAMFLPEQEDRVKIAVRWKGQSGRLYDETYYLTF